MLMRWKELPVVSGTIVAVNIVIFQIFDIILFFLFYDPGVKSADRHILQYYVCFFLSLAKLEVTEGSAASIKAVDTIYPVGKPVELFDEEWRKAEGEKAESEKAEPDKKKHLFSIFEGKKKKEREMRNNYRQSMQE